MDKKRINLEKLFDKNQSPSWFRKIDLEESDLSPFGDLLCENLFATRKQKKTFSILLVPFS